MLYLNMLGLLEALNSKPLVQENFKSSMSGLIVIDPHVLKISHV